MKILTPERFEELKATGQLPSPKGVALAIIDLTRREDVALPEVARVVQSDPALAGRILKFANSAHAGLRRPIASVSDALVVLGLPAVRHIALGLSVLSSHRRGHCKGFDYSAFWSSSLATAIATQQLSGQSKTPPEETFVCGLLSGVGSLALATLFPEEYAQILERAANDPEELRRLEQERFATDHRELTAALLLDWGLPKIFVAAVYHHHAPEEGEFQEGSRDFFLTHSLHLAANLAKTCLAGEKDRHALLPKLYFIATRLGINADGLATLSDRVVAEWQGWGRILDVPTRSLPPFADMADALPQPPAEKSGGTDPSGALRILAVDDSPTALRFMQSVLAAEGHTVYTATNGKEALEKALEFNPQIIVTDWVMPEMDGLSLCKSMRATKAGQRVYIIILTGLGEEARLVEAFEAGADDYMVKPLNERVLKAHLRAGQRVILLQEEIERDREEIRRYAAELAITNRRLQEAALTDPLTGLPNRRHGLDRLEQEWAAAKRNIRPLSCMLLDIDRFKQINDSRGHDVGDAVLRQAARLLKSSARAQDMVCRLGGEEFLMICPDTPAASAAQAAERIRRRFESAPVEVDGLSFRITISIGVAARHSAMPHFDSLLKAADRALYAAKDQGRNRVVLAQDSNEFFWDSPI
jgi:diguanylate cyclase (GGDEF)-like protein